MMKPLRIGVTGVRGVVGEAFTPELVVRFAQAFGTYLDGGRVLVSRDTRPSGPMVKAGVLAGLLAAGCEVIDVGVCPTPSMQLSVRRLGAAGGIAVTAGHNPAEWNALKFVRADGLYFNPMQGEELLDIYHQGEFAKATWDRIATGVTTDDAVEHHVGVLRGAFDVKAIRARRLRVAVDCCNGACSYLVPRWLEELGCEVLSVNDDPAAPFPHNPEPRPETMAQLRAVVKAGRADVGFAHDADGERLGVVTERGVPLSEELTLALAAETRLAERNGGVVVTNVSSSGAVDLIAARYGGAVVRTPVGQAHISEAVVDYGAVIGGEGSGGVCVPEVHPSHDSAAATGLLLERMARTGETVSEMVEGLPKLSTAKHNVRVEPHQIHSLLQNFRGAAEREGLGYDMTDGIKATLPDGWAHVRASNTEAIVRVIVEAADPERARAMLDWARDRLQKP
jgi:phosphomannomutase